MRLGGQWLSSLQNQICQDLSDVPQADLIHSVSRRSSRGILARAQTNHRDLMIRRRKVRLKERLIGFRGA